MNGTDIGFKVAMFENQRGVAKTALETQGRVRNQSGRRQGKLDLPEIELLVDKSNAVGVVFFMRTYLTDNPDECFAVGFERANIHFLIGRQRMCGQDSRAVEAEYQGVRSFREDSAVGVGTKQKNGNLFGQPSTAAVGLKWHLGNLGKGPRLDTPYRIAGERRITLGKCKVSSLKVNGPHIVDAGAASLTAKKLASFCAGLPGVIVFAFGGLDFAGGGEWLTGICKSL
jgi:hypothetical protein